MKTMMQKQLTVCLVVLAAGLTNCGGQNNAADGSAGVESDVSASGLVAGAVGGALSGSNSGGMQARMSMPAPKVVASNWSSLKQLLSPIAKAYADTFCPTYQSTGSDCSANGTSMWLTYSDCTFAGWLTWNGVQELTPSSGTTACGAFPNPGANGTLYRQYVQASGGSTPGALSLVNELVDASVNDADTNLDNFAGVTIATINNGGYGAAVDFGANGGRSSITVGHHITLTGVYDHSLTGTLQISESGPTATSRSIKNTSGPITLYHNLMQVIATSTFSDVKHEDICCLPVAGTITTAFTAAASPAPQPKGEGINLVGKSESLEFTGCGTAIYTDVNGNSKNVTLNHCF